MDSPQTLLSDDFCCLQAAYLQRWQPPALRPSEILRQAIEAGLLSESDDPGSVASEAAMQCCTEREIDTEQTDLLGLAEHIAALADFLAWLLRGQNSPWKHPEPPQKCSTWNTGAFLSPSERNLRQFFLVDRWDAWREVELRHSWAIQGECAAYGVSMDVIVAVIGKMRNGRWVSPFTAAWRHPVAKTLRFQRRDGESFQSTWERVMRETDSATREEWLDAMTDDGVLAESIHVFSVEPERASEIVALAQRKLARIQSGELPDPQLSRCFDRIHPCPFRSCCPNGIEPSEELGFTRRL